MCERVSSDDNPSLILMNYDQTRLAVTNLFFVPKHFFVSEIIQERKPLTATARRAGWVGCNILLNRIPDAGKIYLIRNSVQIAKKYVLDQWKATAFLREQEGPARGWLLEVMKCVDLIGRREFDLAEVYSQEGVLHALYPGNQNVRPKIRQQLQVLRDKGYIEFLGRGRYRRRFEN
jgi:type II restriction enzyme